MKIEVRGNRPDDALESHRPKAAEWHVVISGRWEQDTYHSGWAEYSVARAGPGKWVMDCMEWHGDLDNLTQEEVDAGDINDDQLQQLGSMTLEEAQAIRYHRIVAFATGVPETMTAEKIGELLHKAVLEDGGYEIETWD